MTLFKEMAALLDSLTGRRPREFPPFESRVMWIQQYPTGMLSCMLYTTEEKEKVERTAEAIGESAYGRFIKVRLVEEA